MSKPLFYWKNQIIGDYASLGEELQVSLAPYNAVEAGQDSEFKRVVPSGAQADFEYNFTAVMVRNNASETEYEFVKRTRAHLTEIKDAAKLKLVQESTLGDLVHTQEERISTITLGVSAGSSVNVRFDASSDHDAFGAVVGGYAFLIDAVNPFQFEVAKITANNILSDEITLESLIYSYASGFTIMRALWVLPMCWPSTPIRFVAENGKRSRFTSSVTFAGASEILE